MERLEAASDRSTAMRRLSGWMTRNLRLNGRPYNFKKHEMQEDIASDQHPRQAIKKCSQVGLTELALRLVAAISAVTRSRVIYILPSARFAEKVSTDRFLPIIKDSPVLLEMLHADAKAAAMRKIGNSTAYFTGAAGSTQAISIPATHLIIDEEDFCDPVILGQYNSRLRHAEEDPETGLRGMIKRFSTPTLPGYGVSKHYEASDQKQYMVCCSKCNTWQVPSYYEDYVIPGYDSAIGEFTKTDLANPNYKVSEAYVKCQKCGHDLWADLINPERRQWVPKYPERTMLSGYTVAPIDVPHYNKIPAIFRQLDEYNTIQDHRNFVLGLDYEDENNSFLMSVFENYTDAFQMKPDEARHLTLSGIRFGIDIGKVAHIVIAKRISSNTEDLHVIHYERLSKDKGLLAKQIQELIDAYNPDTVVCDAGPDFSTPQILIENNQYGQVYGCQYHRSVSGAYTHLDPDPDIGLVKADRSGTLSELMKRHNKGNIHYCQSEEELPLVKQHLKVTKKLVRPAEMGDLVVFPKPDKPDHYAHAMNYVNIADKIASDHDILPVAIGILPAVTGVTIGSNATKDKIK